MTAHAVEIAATVEVLRDRARLIVAAADKTAPGWRATAVRTLRDTPGTRWADFSDLVAAVRWAIDNPDN